MKLHYHDYVENVKIIECLSCFNDGALITWYAINAIKSEDPTVKLINVIGLASDLNLCRQSIYRHLLNRTYFKEVPRSENGLTPVVCNSIESIVESMHLEIGSDSFNTLDIPSCALGDKRLLRKYIKKWKSDRHKAFLSTFALDQPKLNEHKEAENGKIFEIKAKNGTIYLVDEEDYKKHGSYVWTENIKGYASRVASAHESLEDPRRRRFNILLHREILGLPRTGLGYKFIGEHINNDRKDNRRCNLQITTQRHNARKEGRSKGLYLTKSKNKWMVFVCLPRTVRGQIAQKVYLGTFDTIEKAEAVCRRGRELMSKNLHPKTEEPLPPPLYAYYDGEFGSLI